MTRWAGAVVELGPGFGFGCVRGGGTFGGAACMCGIGVSIISFFASRVVDIGGGGIGGGRTCGLNVFIIDFSASAIACRRVRAGYTVAGEEFIFEED